MYNLACPFDVVTTTSNTSFATVDLVVPTITPSNDEITVVQVPETAKPRDQFPIGTTVISYEAVKNGEIVANCSYKIIVDGKQQYLFFA